VFIHFWVFIQCYCNNFQFSFERINSKKTFWTSKHISNEYMIYHEESLKCQGKLDVSNSIIFYQKKKKNHYGPPEDPVKVTGNGKGCFFWSKLPPPVVFSDSSLSYTRESRRPALLVICVIQDGGGFVMFHSTQKWSFPVRVRSFLRHRGGHLF